jgi:hypothetical protein
MELIGPDCETQKPGWTAELRREDADVVGNVIVHTAAWRNAIRMGGDLNGRSQGRVRLVNNTILFANSGQANAVMVQLGAESLEMHNNVVYQIPAGSTPAIVRENPPGEVATPFCGPQSREPWSSGRKVHGSNNWVQTAATLVPGEWTATRRGGNPGFVNASTRSLRPAAGSPLINAGNNAPPTAPAFPFPSPLALPAFDPALRAKMAIGDQHPRLIHGSAIDIGALEDVDVDEVIEATPREGSQPLLPPPGGGTSSQVTQPSAGDPPAALAPAPPSTPPPPVLPASPTPGDATQAAPRTFWSAMWARFMSWLDRVFDAEE